MKTRDSLREASRRLSGVSDEAEFEAELLLRHVLSIDRACLYQQLDDQLADDDNHTFHALIQRRLTHEPAAYMLGRKEFFGLEIEVGPAVFIPRPETESLVEAVIAFANERFADSPVQIAEVGTGSGAIAIAVAHSLPLAGIVAIDSSPEALTLAHRNASQHRLNNRIRFVHGDLLDAVEARFDVIAANLPYVTTSDLQQLPPEIRDHEPWNALDGGPDGLQLIARLLEQAPRHLTPGGALFAEIGDQQAQAATDIGRSAFPAADITVVPDLAGRDRVLIVRT